MKMEARDHRRHEALSLNPRKVEREAGSVAEKVHKTELGATISLPEGVDDIKLS